MISLIHDFGVYVLYEELLLFDRILKYFPARKLLQFHAFQLHQLIRIAFKYMDDSV